MEITEFQETRGKKKELDHEKFMRAKGIEIAELPEELKEADKILKEAKKEDFQAANEASKLLLEALQESIYEINDTIEKIGETLTDHEERIENLEKEVQRQENVDAIIDAVQTQAIMDLQEENQEQKKQIEQLQEEAEEAKEQEGLLSEAEAKPSEQEQETFSSKEEAILAKLYADGVEYITKIELKALGFNVSFCGKLGARGATYGAYKLKKAPSEKVYKVLKLL